MNEQIKKLHDQAFAETTDYYATMQRFAELIVRECMNVLDPGEHQLIARFQARKWLAEHFGVK